MSVTLGLDLGPNSIGWALIEEDLEGPGKSKLIDIGVRVFPEGVDAFDTGKEKSRNEERRLKRGLRRQTKRRSRREKLLSGALVGASLWPITVEEQSAELAKDPYKLRATALEKALKPYEIGRVFLHLARRRGFLSNRKKDSSDVETAGMLAEITRNEQERIEGGYETIGAMLHAKSETLEHTNRKENDHIRNRHLSRQQIAEEFLAIWRVQQGYHPLLLDDNLLFGEIGPEYVIDPRTGERVISHNPRRSIARKDARRNGASDLESFGIFGVMFFQRKMYWPTSVVGLCEFEPGQKRCSKADRIAQQFRVLLELNNLRFVVDGEEFSLNAEQRKLALSILANNERVTFDQLRHKLNLVENVRFNLESGQRPALKGMSVDVALSKATGKEWHGRDDSEKTAIVRLLLNEEFDENYKINRLRAKHRMTLGQAERALSVNLPTGFVSLSRKAIEKLLPHLQEGLILQSASDPEVSALHAAGYLRRDELQRRLFNQLPDLSRLKASDCKLGDIPNPVVKRALVELRKVVNAIIREYGKPDAITVEMARSVQVGAKKRKETNKKMRDNEKRRDAAALSVRKAGVSVNRDSILRQIFWEQQNYCCTYCCRAISQHQLFEGGVDIDHILPYSRCLDDSQMNKVVVHQECNHAKGQRTPYEWLSASAPTKYDEVVQFAESLLRAGKIPYAKYKRFLQKELILDNFIARQLVDTGYITSATVEYLKLLFDKPHDVLGVRGQLTSELRWQWGLETILSEFPDSPAWNGADNLRPGKKNRADNRHHAIDALVVALTNRSRLKRLTRLYREGGARRHGEILEEPWDNFRQSVVERLRHVNVSYRVQRKVAGALHEETLYGKGTEKGEWVTRKPIETLSAAEFGRIRDPQIRRIVLSKLAEAGLDVGRGKSLDQNRLKAALANLSMPSGVPIKKVRVLKPEQTICQIRHEDETAYVKPGSTHHLCIFEFRDGGRMKRDAIFVTMLEAARRIKLKMPIICRIHPERPDATFIMSLSSRELVLANWKGVERLLVFKTAASTQGQLYFADQYDARRSSEQQKYVATANSLDAVKVTVDPLGRIRHARD